MTLKIKLFLLSENKFYLILFFDLISEKKFVTPEIQVQHTENRNYKTYETVKSNEECNR